MKVDTFLLAQLIGLLFWKKGYDVMLFLCTKLSNLNSVLEPFKSTLFSNFFERVDMDGETDFLFILFTLQIYILLSKLWKCIFKKSIQQIQCGRSVTFFG